jgi:hypothetical protein
MVASHPVSALISPIMERLRSVVPSPPFTFLINGTEIKSDLFDHFTSLQRLFSAETFQVPKDELYRHLENEELPRFFFGLWAIIAIPNRVIQSMSTLTLSSNKTGFDSSLQFSTSTW